MDLRTRFAGLELDNPLVVGASPMGEHLDAARRCEDAGAAAFVMNSLFMEQVLADELHLQHIEVHHDVHPEAATYLPELDRLAEGPDHYLEQLARLRSALAIPIVASLNGTRGGRWVRYARLCEEAGASAIELNVYHLPFSAERSGAEVEEQVLGVLAAVCDEVEVPVVLKLLPLLSSPPHFAARAAAAGASGLVLFNRLFHPDLDVEELEVRSHLHLSPDGLLGDRLLWLAVLHGQVAVDLAASGGVRGALDVVRCLMAGASAVQVVSEILRHGPEHLGVLRTGLERWLEEHGYGSVGEAIGALSLARCPNPEDYGRANYMRVLHAWRP